MSMPLTARPAWNYPPRVPALPSRTQAWQDIREASRGDAGEALRVSKELSE
jgi:hypothetical protein